MPASEQACSCWRCFWLPASQRVIARAWEVRAAVTERFASSSIASTAKKPDFDTQIKPIFQARCQPCHFPGGKVYDHLPFDQPETITRLGEKLFTRIKDKVEQRLIREFLAP